MSLLFAVGLLKTLVMAFVMTLAMLSPTAQAQMFLDEGDEVSEAGVSDSVTSSPRGKATSNQRKPQSKAAWAEKRKSQSQRQSKAVAKNQQKRASMKSAVSSVQTKVSHSAKAAPVVKNAKSKSSASAPVASKASNAKSGQRVAAVSSTRSATKSPSKPTAKVAAKPSGGKGRAPASASTFATTKKSCPLQVSPGANENIGITKFPRKLWVQDAGNANYFKVVNREGREGFVKKSCFE